MNPGEHMERFKGEFLNLNEGKVKKFARNVLSERIEQVKCDPRTDTKNIYLTFTGSFQSLLALKMLSELDVKLYRLILPSLDDDVMNATEQISRRYETIVWDYRKHQGEGCPWIAATNHFTKKNDGIRIASCILSATFDHSVFSENEVFLFKTPYGIKCHQWYGALIDLFHNIYPKHNKAFYIDCPHPEKCGNAWSLCKQYCKKMNSLKLGIAGFTGDD